MELTVQSTTRESKQAQGKTYWGVKHTDGNWYNVITNDKPSQGQKLNVDVKESDWNGKTYRWATINQKAQAKAASSGGNGHALTWDEYAAMARNAHGLAEQLEKDIPNQSPGDMFVDRSAARAAIVNTVMIAVSNGKIALPEEEEYPTPPPFDDDIPF